MNLSGRTILITRAASQANQLVRLIEEQGGKAIVFPTIEITPPNNWDECDKAINGLYMYDGLMFTSVNGVEYFFHRLTENKITSCDIDKKIIMAVGEKTKRAIEQRYLNVTIIPEKFTASELANKLQQEDIKGKCFLFLRGNLAKDTLPEKVKMLGAQVDSVVVYQTNEPIPKNIDFIKKLLSNHEIDIVT
ncbi:MAG: uroporphyrinogen-III synthase, partial [Ignavibacteriales bacterium]|nr:uroporphyrinogen-III synthase [Ignavibacteriales bacterium]